MFEIRKNLDLRKILVTPEIFLKSRFHCTDNKWSQDRTGSPASFCCNNWRSLQVLCFSLIGKLLLYSDSLHPAQYIAFIWLQIMTVPKFQTPLACFEKWLSPDFTCQKVEEAQKVSLKGCASAILLHHYKSSRPRWIVRRCSAQWVAINS